MMSEVDFPRLLVIDRDGVINRDRQEYVRRLADWEPEPGSISALARASKAGYVIAIATNQSGIARGFLSPTELARIHRHLEEIVTKEGGVISLIRYCPHQDSDHCDCRKPAPGLLLQIGQQLGYNLAQVPFVGDALSDLKAAEAANMKPVLVLTGKGEQTLRALVAAPQEENLYKQTQVFQSLAHYVDNLLCHPDQY